MMPTQSLVSQFCLFHVYYCFVGSFLRAVKMNEVLHSDFVQAPELSLVSSAQQISPQLREMCLSLVIIIVVISFLIGRKRRVKNEDAQKFRVQKSERWKGY